jgi:hypothetical protein
VEYILVGTIMLRSTEGKPIGGGIKDKYTEE